VVWQCGAFANIDQLGVAATVIENRTDVWLNSVLTEHHIYNAANQVAGWSYDETGNLLDDGTSQYSYDPMGWLMMPTGGGQTRSYTYDADGTLATQTTGGEHRRVRNRGHGGGELRSFSEHPPRRHIIHKTKVPNGGAGARLSKWPQPDIPGCRVVRGIYCIQSRTATRSCFCYEPFFRSCIPMI